MEQQKLDERNALNDKLKAAANLRDENIKRILSRLREHVRVVIDRGDIIPIYLLKTFILTNFCCINVFI